MGSGALEPRRRALVAGDHHAVPAEADVELEVRHAERECAPEGFERVPRAEPARPAMSLNLKMHAHAESQRSRTFGYEPGSSSVKRL